MATIKFIFEDKKLEPKSIQAMSGDNISELADDNDIHINHNCGRVCACSTCHIYILKGEDFLQEISDREEDFIDRATNPKINSRLACQCKILKNTDNQIIEVLVPDQSRIIGHEH
jgi:2Fe-2S ferredoxin